MKRNYRDICLRVRPNHDKTAAMQQVVDILWDDLRLAGVSWVGFYLPSPPDELTLGPMRNKPACSPIKLHGACGRCYLEKKAIIVRDVAELGQDYIACDPKDRSEVVVPLLDHNDNCWAVLDLDSHEYDAFDLNDVTGLIMVLEKANLTFPPKE